VALTIVTSPDCSSLLHSIDPYFVDSGPKHLCPFLHKVGTNQLSAAAIICLAHQNHILLQTLKCLSP